MEMRMVLENFKFLQQFLCRSQGGKLSTDSEGLEKINDGMKTS
jgi:hypothetical protein